MNENREAQRIVNTLKYFGCVITEPRIHLIFPNRVDAQYWELGSRAYTAWDR